MPQDNRASMKFLAKEEGSVTTQHQAEVEVKVRTLT